MDSFILTTRDEYRSNLYIAILLLIIIIPSCILCYNNNIHNLIWLGLFVFSLVALWCIYDYIRYSDKRNSQEILVVNKNGITIKNGIEIKQINWTDITAITLYMGSSRMDGLMMSISVYGKNSVKFSFFKFSLSIRRLRRLVKTIKYYSMSPNILKYKSGLRWILEPG